MNITTTPRKITVTIPNVIQADFYEGNEFTDPVLNAIEGDPQEAARFSELLQRRFTAEENPEKAGQLKGVSLAVKDFRGMSDADYNVLMGIEE